jgi:hypothetical protein
MPKAKDSYFVRGEHHRVRVSDGNDGEAHDDKAEGRHASFRIPL